MTTDTQPADTRMMRIVHNALRRDIAHAQSALTRWPYPEPSQRAAIVKHLLWMMQFLRRHHSAEDDGLYPLVRQRVPEAAHVLDAVDADHHALIPEIDKLAHSARRYAQDPSARTELVTALNELAAVMLPHLQREETDMMPVVSAAVTKAEWDAIETDPCRQPAQADRTGLHRAVVVRRGHRSGPCGLSHPPRGRPFGCLRHARRSGPAGRRDTREPHGALG